MLEIFSYKMKHDTGFAPNPFWGTMTLATCKPDIRLRKKIGQWVAGFTSKSLCGDEVGSERLIYLMEITDKIHIKDYYHHPKFQNKIPDSTRMEKIYKVGDNIYIPEKAEEQFRMVPNSFHCSKHKENDLKGQFVLISDNFYYFGSKPLDITFPIKDWIRCPRTQSRYGIKTFGEQAENFIEHIQKQYKPGVNHSPFCWPADDISWSEN